MFCVQETLRENASPNHTDSAIRVPEVRRFVSCGVIMPGLTPVRRGAAGTIETGPVLAGLPVL